MPASRNPNRYRLVVKESPATCKALPVSISGRNKRRQSSESGEVQVQSPKQKAHQRGCYHLEPNPVLMLEVDAQDTRCRHMQNPYLLCTVRLMEYDEGEKDWVPSNPKVFRGLQTHTLQTRTKRVAHKPSEYQQRGPPSDMTQGFFVFHNLTIAAEGRYKLKFTLQEVQLGSLSTQVSCLTYVFSNEFEVVRSTAHVKKPLSSQLAQELKDCGFRLFTRTKAAPRKPKIESWDVNGAPHEIIHQFQTQNPGSFQVVQRQPGPRLVPPLGHSRQQNGPYHNLNSGMANSFQTSGSSMPFSTEMMPRSMPLGQSSGYTQFIDQRYSLNGQVDPPYSTSTGTQGYSLASGTAYSAPNISTQTLLDYSTQNDVMHAGNYTPEFGDGGDYLNLGSGTMSTGYQQPVLLGSMNMNSALGASDSRL